VSRYCLDVETSLAPSVSEKELLVIERLASALEKAASVDEIKDVRDRAMAIALYSRKKKSGLLEYASRQYVPAPALAPEEDELFDPDMDETQILSWVRELRDLWRRTPKEARDLFVVQMQELIHLHKAAK
jgi:hypothetical protein